MQPWDNRAELVSTAISSTTPPHIIMTNRQETFQFAGLGLIRPIDEFVAESGLDLSLFYDGEVGNQYWAGELYALPLPTAGGLTGMFFYNKDMLAAAGIDGPPATWQELEAAAQAINVGDAMGIDILGATSGSSAGDFITWLYTNNGRYVDDLGRVLMFNNAEGVETLEWMIRFTNDINGGIENITDFFQGADFTTSDHPWYRSEFAFNPINTSHFNHMNKVAPDFFAATDSWGVMMRPYNGNNPDAKTAGVVAIPPPVAGATPSRWFTRQSCRPLPTASPSSWAPATRAAASSSSRRVVPRRCAHATRTRPTTTPTPTGTWCWKALATTWRCPLLRCRVSCMTSCTPASKRPSMA